MNTIMSGMSSCKKCGMSIRWMKAPNGKNIPANPESTLPEDTVFHSKVHSSHFDTCIHRLPEQMPPAANWRGRY
ncbi:MAG: hypothetical protein ABI778_04410 [Ignavibacteriota bacterium]